MKSSGQILITTSLLGSLFLAGVGYAVMWGSAIKGDVEKAQTTEQTHYVEAIATKTGLERDVQYLKDRSDEQSKKLDAILSAVKK